MRWLARRRYNLIDSTCMIVAAHLIRGGAVWTTLALLLIGALVSTAVEAATNQEDA